MYRVWIPKSEGKMLFGRSIYIKEDGITFDLKEIARDGVDGTQLARVQWNYTVNNSVNIWNQ
jgi:hypothetical protein